MRREEGEWESVYYRKKDTMYTDVHTCTYVYTCVHIHCTCIYMYSTCVDDLVTFAGVLLAGWVVLVGTLVVLSSAVSAATWDCFFPAALPAE